MEDLLAMQGGGDPYPSFLLGERPLLEIVHKMFLMN